MSLTVPHAAAEPPAEDALAARRPWPCVTLGFGGSVVEWRGLSLFVRFARREIYVCTAEISDWWTLREPECFEAAMGRLRFSMARATDSGEP